MATYIDALEGKHTNGSEQLPRGKKAVTPRKKAKEPLPKDFWDTVEEHLPNYHSREDVAECNDYAAKKDNGGKLTAVEARRFDSLNRKLYNEALAASEQKAPCRYCGGNCANDEDNCCDGYSGDIDGLYKKEN